MSILTSKVQIPDRLYFRIGDVAELLGVKPYVLRFWESEFSIITPQKSSSGQRVYRRPDVETLLMIKHLLYEERYSIEGAKRRIKELRKEGDLKLFKDVAVASATVPPSEKILENTPMLESISEILEAQRQVIQEAFTNQQDGSSSELPTGTAIDTAKIQELLQELKSLSQIPISELFSL